MTHLSPEAKEALVAKVLSGTESVRGLTVANDIGYSSLQRWVYQVRKTGSSAVSLTTLNTQSGKSLFCAS